MRIALFTNNYLPRMSGVATSVENLRQALLALGHTVYVIAPKYRGAKTNGRGIIRVPSLRWSKKYFFPIALPLTPKLTNKIARLKLDIIHSHHPAWLGQSAQNLNKQLKLPFVFTYHAQYEKYPEEFFGVTLKPIEEWAKFNLKEYMGNCNAVIAPSQTIAKKLRRQTGTRVIKIPSGINLDQFDIPASQKNALKENLGLGRFTKIILSVARLSFEKELDFMLTALAPLLKNNPGCGLVLVGDGLARGALHEIARELGIAPQVIFAGTINYKYLPRWYRAADVFVYSSRFETQGLTLIEAMASGLPVVTRHSDVAAECLGNPAAGVITPASSRRAFRFAVAQLLNDKIIAEELGQQAKRRSRYFSSLETGKMHEELYQKLISSF